MMNLRNSLSYLYNNKILLRIMAIVALIGVADTVYLTANYYFGNEVKCLVTEGCEVVLTSKYSKILSFPLAGFGLMFYAGMFILVNMFDIYRERYLLKILVTGGIVGFAASLVFLYIQLFVLEALCFYCLMSFCSSTLLLILATMVYRRVD